MKIYKAIRGQGVFVQNGSKRQLLRHIPLHSPSGFEWGYGGSGPADLAYAILADAVGKKEAERFYQTFKWEFIAKAPFDGFEISRKEVRRWVVEQLV